VSFLRGTRPGARGRNQDEPGALPPGRGNRPRGQGQAHQWPLAMRSLQRRAEAGPPRLAFRRLPPVGYRKHRRLRIQVREAVLCRRAGRGGSLRGRMAGRGSCRGRAGRGGWMTAVMKRAARRAVLAERPRIETGITIVPMELSERYYYTQI